MHLRKEVPCYFKGMKMCLSFRKPNEDFNYHNLGILRMVQVNGNGEDLGILRTL